MKRGRKAAVDKNPGIRAAAAALGVSPGHLSRVVSGQRQSDDLLQKYLGFIQSRKNPTQPTT